MGFFKTPPPPEDEDFDDDDVGPAWLAPPRFEVPGCVDHSFVLAHDERVAVTVEGIACYSTGFKLTVRALSRSGRFEGEELDFFDPFEMQRMGLRARRRGELPDELLRFGVEFPDGSKVTNLEFPFEDLDWDEDDEPDGPTLMMEGGGGGGGSWEQEMWIRPLPGEGTVRFVCEWPAFDIRETRVDLDAGVLRAASERARVLWLDRG